MKAYRYVDQLVSTGSEEYGYHAQVSFYLQEFDIIKETPKGFWIELYEGKKRFIRSKANKKFACRTKENALISFQKRKEIQIKILENQLQNAKNALNMSRYYIINKK